ncbi:MAG: PDZ domain-containing protein [Anaerolineae bacterium]|nr:PDZ domain-containing protein [Anaerolineae bacterium]
MKGILSKLTAQRNSTTGHGRERPAWYYFPYVFIALTAMTVLVAAILPTSWPDDGVKWGLAEGRVLFLSVGGPGEKSGLQPGDVVLTVDGQPFSRTPLYAGRSPGQTVALEVQRDGRIETFDVVLAAPDVTVVLWRLIPLLVAASFWIAGVLIFVLRPRVGVCRAYFLLAQTATVALSSGGLSTFNLMWAVYVFYLTLLALPPLLSYFYVALAAPRRSLIRSFPRYLSVLSGFLMLFWLLASPFPSSAWGNAQKLTVTFLPIWRITQLLYLTVALLGFMFGLLYTYWTTRSADLRRRLRGLVLSTVAGSVPMIFFSLLPNVMLGVGAGLSYQFTFPFLTLTPLTHAYVTIKYDLAPFDRFLNRSLVVFILGLLWAVFYLTGTGIGMVFSTQMPLLQLVAGMAATMVMAALLVPLREKTQRIVDRLFYGGWYDYRGVISRLSNTLSGLARRDELAARLVELVAEGLRLEGAALYLYTPAGELLLEGYVGLDVPPQLSEQMVQAWAGQRLPVSGLPAGNGVSMPAPFSEAAVKWYVPLTTDEKSLGLLLLGPKRGDDFFDPADMDILQTLREQAALAVENVSLMSDLQQMLRAMEAVQQRLLAVREEERRVLAWELHDGPVQDLVALSYQLCDCRDGLQDPELVARLETLRRESLRIMQVLREVCGGLRSDVLDIMGVGPALLQYAQDVMRKKDVVIELTVPSRTTRLPDPLGITLLRVFQEAVNNAISHAGTREIWGHLQIGETEYELRVWDQGQGFVLPRQVESFISQGHYGLATMKERIAALGGEMEIRSAPGAGTAVRVWGQIDDEQ